MLGSVWRFQSLPSKVAGGLGTTPGTYPSLKAEHYWARVQRTDGGDDCLLEMQG